MLVAILIPGALNATTKNVLFSRLKIQIGEVATEFVDDTSLFVQSPSVDSTMLQDGCIARPGLFQPNVIPAGAYQAKSIKNGDIDDKAIDGRTMADGAAVANLGFTPINKAGDAGPIGPGPLNFVNDDVVGTGSVAGASAIIAVSSANAANDGYMPAIAFRRSGTLGRAIGLSTTGRFRTVDTTGATGYLLDSVFQVATTDVQDKAITLAKLAQEVINMIIPPGILAFFGGSSPPSGWFVADGTAVSRTTYAALFAAIGTIWGAGDNVTTFNLPDLRGRAPIGYVNKAAPGITARAFGARGGEESHTLALAEIPSHDHGYSQSPHDHGTHSHSVVNSQGTVINVAAGSNQPIVYVSGAIATSANPVPASNANINFAAQGSNGAHNTMMPFSVGYWIVKS
jgi:microcystin-dependent protein